MKVRIDGEQIIECETVECLQADGEPEFGRVEVGQFPHGQTQGTVEHITTARMPIHTIFLPTASVGCAAFPLCLSKYRVVVWDELAYAVRETRWADRADFCFTLPGQDVLDRAIVNPDNGVIYDPAWLLDNYGKITPDDLPK